MPKKSKPAKYDTLHDLLILKLKALYDVETQLVKALPKMAKNASSKELKQGFEHHLEQTEDHVQRLEECFELLGEKPTKTEVDAIRGLVSDAEWVIKNVKNKQALDAALIAAAQYVEHYEIAGYGSAAQWAEDMGHDEVKELLGQTLEEEKETDENLSELAKSEINEAANDMKEE